MSENRLFSSSHLSPDSEMTLSPEQSRYVRNVLRLKVGDRLVVFDGTGTECPATISTLGRQSVGLLTGSEQTRNVESRLAVHLVQGISRGERMDMVVQKATELGVRRISPVLTRYSVVKLDPDRSARRTGHWQKVSQSACEQCGRNIVPQIDAPLALGDYLQQASGSAAQRLFLHPDGGSHLDAMPDDVQSVEIVVGPEGGLHENECDRLRSAGYGAVSMGPRILRTETAAIVALAIAQHRWGDI